MELRNSSPASAGALGRASLDGSATRRNLASVAIEDLHPTQFTVGYREVAVKRRQWRDASPSGREALLERRSAPVVIGPDRILYALDRHHWLCALHVEGVKAAPVHILADLHNHDIVTFWPELESCGWCHPYDAEGARRDSRALPTSMAALQDDPFRSLASAVRRAGGFDKDATLFSEFRWADYLRRQIPRACVEEDFAAAIEEALQLCRGTDRLTPCCPSISS